MFTQMDKKTYEKNIDFKLFQSRNHEKRRLWKQIDFQLFQKKLWASKVEKKLFGFRKIFEEKKFVFKIDKKFQNV